MKDQIIVKKGEKKPDFDEKTEEIAELDDPYFSIVLALKEISNKLDNLSYRI